MTAPTPTVAVIGAGRLGRTVAAALRAAGITVIGPGGRGSTGAGADLVLLCVPDDQIAAAAALVIPGPLVGHCSGSNRLEPLGGHEAFSWHPLMTIPPTGARFDGVPCAIAGSTPRAEQAARDLADRLGMRPVTVPDQHRAAYHAAASVASNFLVTVLDFADRLARSAGVDRELLGPLVRAAVENWLGQGGPAVITGPVARGDKATVARQRAAVADRLPADLALFDTLVLATRELADVRKEPL